METGFDDSLTAGGYLGLQETSQEVRIGPPIRGGLLGDGVQLGVSGGGADLQQRLQGELLVVVTHESPSA